jgi:hypothetical protein
MCCSDYPHSEGTAHPIADYAATGKFAIEPAERAEFFSDNMNFLLQR